MLRSAFETLFCLCACKEGVDVVDKLIAADIARKKTTALELSKLPGELGFGPEAIAKMRGYVDQHPDKYGKLDLFRMAAAANLGEVYTVYYRSLSYDAAHPTMGSLERHVRKNDQSIHGFEYGPDVDDVAKTLGYSAVVGLYLLKISADVFGMANLDQSLTEIWPRYKDLIGETFPDFKEAAA